MKNVHLSKKSHTIGVEISVHFGLAVGFPRRLPAFLHWELISGGK